MSKKLFLLFLILPIFSLHIATSAPAEELKFPLLWTIDLNTLLESAPTVADINGDGRDEIIIAGREEIFALNQNGRKLWRRRGRGRFMTYPAVLTDAGGKSYIYAADDSGQLTCLDGSGKIVWQTELHGPSSWSAPVICDLDGDDEAEVVQTDETGAVWAFSAYSGKVVWQTAVQGKPVSPAVGDLNGDGKLEIVVATGKGLVSAIKSDGSLLWQIDIGGHSDTWATSAPVIFAASDGSVCVVVASGAGQFFCLDESGKIIWQHFTLGASASSISVGDFDLDGRADIFLITQLGVIYRYDESGHVLWQIDMQGRSLAPGAIIDLDQDGRLEYLVCTQRGHLLAFDQDGHVVYDYQFDNRTINVTPAFGDVARSAGNLEFVITGGESGKTFCFGAPARKNALSQWAAYRHDSHNTGSWFGLKKSHRVRMIPQNLFWNQLFNGEPVRFRIINPAPSARPLKAVAVCIKPDGSRQTAMTRIIGRKGILLMPVDFVVPGTYQFTWFLKDAGGQKLVAGSKNVSLSPFNNERAVIQQATDALSVFAAEVKNILPLSSKALLQRLRQTRLAQAEILSLQDAIPGSDAAAIRETLKKTAELVAESNRNLQICDVIKQAASLEAGTSLITFTGKKWENRRVDRQLPVRVMSPLHLQYTVVPQEHQPVPLLLFNITDRLLNVRVQISPSSDQIVVTPLHSVDTPTSLGEVSWDALPEMDESGIVSIPSLSSREIWLDVKTASAAANRQKITVRLQALNGAGVLAGLPNPQAVPAPESRVEIVFNVLPFAMAPPGKFRLCTWSPSTGPEVEDLLAHGNNVFIVPHGKAKLAKNGELLSVDFSQIDSIVKGFRNHDVMLLLQGFPVLHSSFENDHYQAELTGYLNRLVAHLQNLGFDTAHFALYPIDEPGGHGWDAVNKMVRFGEMVRAANPKIQLYVDGGGEAPMFRAMAPTMGIWCPPIDWLPENSPEMKVMRTTGKLLWSYNCSYGYSRPIGPNIKNSNVVAEYRTAALFAFRHGAGGIGYWCYNAGRENPWMRIKSEYNIVYPGRNKPVTSRRWEAVREGIEDYRILAALRKKLNGSEPLSEILREKIKHLLHISLPDLVDPGFKAMKLGLAREAIDLNFNDTRMDTFRQEMMACVRLLCDEEQR